MSLNPFESTDDIVWHMTNLGFITISLFLVSTWEVFDKSALTPLYYKTTKLMPFICGCQLYDR